MGKLQKEAWRQLGQCKLYAPLGATSMFTTPIARLVIVGNAHSLDPHLLDNLVWVIPKQTSAVLAPVCRNTRAVQSALLIGAAQNPAISGQAKQFFPLRSLKGCSGDELTFTVSNCFQ